MVQNRMAKVDVDVTLSLASMYVNLIKELDGLSMILKQRMKDGKMSEQKEQNKKATHQEMKQSESPEPIEKNTEHGAEVLSENETHILINEGHDILRAPHKNRYIPKRWCKRCIELGWTSEFVAGVKAEDEPVSKKAELGGAVGRNASWACDGGKHEECSKAHDCQCRCHGSLPGDVKAEEVPFEYDLVNHHHHYKSKAECPGCGRPIECIDVIEHMDSNIAAAVKYLWHYKDKGDPLQDLRKARWYIQREGNRIRRISKRERWEENKKFGSDFVKQDLENEATKDR